MNKLLPILLVASATTALALPHKETHGHDEYIQGAVKYNFPQVQEAYNPIDDDYLNNQARYAQYGFSDDTTSKLVNNNGIRAYDSQALQPTSNEPHLLSDKIRFTKEKDMLVQQNGSNIYSDNYMNKIRGKNFFSDVHRFYTNRVKPHINKLMYYTGRLIRSYDAYHDI